MPISEQDKTPLERMAEKVIDGRYVINAVRFSQLNPEQQLAYALEMLLVHEKGHLALLQSILPITAACVEWRKTPEGQAWTAKQEERRALKDVTLTDVRNAAWDAITALERTSYTEVERAAAASKLRSVMDKMSV